LYQALGPEFKLQYRPNKTEQVEQYKGGKNLQNNRLPNVVVHVCNLSVCNSSYSGGFEASLGYPARLSKALKRAKQTQQNTALVHSSYKSVRKQLSHISKVIKNLARQIGKQGENLELLIVFKEKKSLTCM
jgi:hypothetical protein